VLGDHGQLLVTESNRSLQTRTLLAYNTATVRSLIRESHSLSESIISRATVYQTSQAVQPSAGVTAELTVSAIALQRNKRALLVYHQQRIEVLKDKFWEKGGVLSAAFGAETDTRKHMATVDEAFAKGYAELCLAFKTSWYGDPDERGEDNGVQLMDATDLLGGGVEAAPPRDLFVSVRVLSDVGDVETVSGAKLSLNKGSQYFLAREDVENMVVQGFVEIID
jgi:hypothetical protein